MAITRREFSATGGSALIVATSSVAYAQSYPTKVVKMVIPWPVGGIVDTHARALTAELQKKWGQPVIVESRPGGNGIIGAEYSAKSSPDGYTIYNGNDSSIAMNPYLYKNLSYDPRRDFEPIVSMIAGTSLVVVSSSVPAKTLKEFVEYAKSRPRQINYGSFGIGSKTHIDTEALCRLLGIELTHVPYKGVADVSAALAGGEIQLGLGVPGALLQNVSKGVTRPLVMTGNTRSVVFPDVPTIVEAGGPQFLSRAWFGLFAPAKTPANILERIAADVTEISNEPTFKEKYVIGLGLEPLVLGRKEFGELISQDTAFYADALAKLNVKLE